jgi:hypothetical protein
MGCLMEFYESLSIYLLYEIVFQNPQMFGQPVRFSSEHYTLVIRNVLGYSITTSVQETDAVKCYILSWSTGPLPYYSSSPTWSLGQK